MDSILDPDQSKLIVEWTEDQAAFNEAQKRVFAQPYCPFKQDEIEKNKAALEGEPYYTDPDTGEIVYWAQEQSFTFKIQGLYKDSAEDSGEIVEFPNTSYYDYIRPRTSDDRAVRVFSHKGNNVYEVKWTPTVENDFLTLELSNATTGEESSTCTIAVTDKKLDVFSGSVVAKAHSSKGGVNGSADDTDRKCLSFSDDVINTTAIIKYPVVKSGKQGREHTCKAYFPSDQVLSWGGKQRTTVCVEAFAKSEKLEDGGKEGKVTCSLNVSWVGYSGDFIEYND